MGEEPRTSGTSVTGNQDPDQLRQEIEGTRQELGDTVEALAAKTDVKAQAKRKAAEAKSSAVDKKDELLGKAKDLSPDSAAGAASEVSNKVRRNPLPLAATGAFLAGFLAGRLTK